MALQVPGTGRVIQAEAVSLGWGQPGLQTKRRLPCHLVRFRSRRRLAGSGHLQGAVPDRSLPGPDADEADPDSRQHHAGASGQAPRRAVRGEWRGRTPLRRAPALAASARLRSAPRAVGGSCSFKNVGLSRRRLSELGRAPQGSAPRSVSPGCPVPGHAPPALASRVRSRREEAESTVRLSFVLFLQKLTFVSERSLGCCVCPRRGDRGVGAPPHARPC